MFDGERGKVRICHEREHGLGYGKGLVRFSQRQQPGGVPIVFARVLAVGINQDVDVG